MVEFVLALPFLVLVLFGAIDLNRAFQTYIVVTNTSREGARFGSTHPTDNTGIRDRAIAEATNSGVTITVSDPVCYDFDNGSAVACSSAHNGDKIMVRTAATFEFATLYLFGLKTMPISTSTTMPITSGGQPKP